LVTKEDLIPSLIPNTSMQKIFVDGVHTQYGIKANKGYVLHDKDLDEYRFDFETETLTDEIILGFYDGIRTVRFDYDFTENPREFYATLKTDLSEGKTRW
jgi:hypothetical protein